MEANQIMFFRREKAKTYSFEDRLSDLRSAGFQIESAPRGGTRAIRGGCAADLSDSGDGVVGFGSTGVLVGSEMGELVDVGYQKVWMTPSGRKVAAEADQLKALHAFTEDLREAVGLTSLYNQGLGTTNEKHLYDRVQNRDQGQPDRPWLKALH